MSSFELRYVPDFRTPFQELFEIKHAEPIGKTGNAKKIACRVLHVPSPNEAEYIEITGKIKLWAKEATRLLRANRYISTNLTRLQEIANEVWSTKKIEVLKRNVANLSLDPVRIQNIYEEIADLEAIFEEIIKTPRLELLHFALTNSGHVVPPWFSFSTDDASITPLMIEEHQAVLWENTMRSKKIHAICQNTMQSGQDWQERLLDEFKKLPIIEIKALANQIDALQTTSLISQLKNNSEYREKLFQMIIALPPKTFDELTTSLEHANLYALNKIFQESDETILADFIEALRKRLTKLCNLRNEQIDAISDHLRDDLGGVGLSFKDINDFSSIANEIKLRLEQISNLSIVFRECIKNCESQHVLLKGITKDYNIHLERVTSTEEYENRPAGCLFGIIYRNVFQQNGLEDTDDAYEIFSAWHVWEKKDYLELGIEDFSKVNEFLALFGIRTIKDWKDKLIFNKNMFKEFLARDENKAILSR